MRRDGQETGAAVKYALFPKLTVLNGLISK